jgi:hypothetical protein
MNTQSKDINQEKTNIATKTVNIPIEQDNTYENTLQSNELSTQEVIEMQEITEFKKKVDQYITLIITDDEELIDYEYIYNRGHHYIKLYKENYLTYLEKLKQITNKYYNKKKYGFNNNNKKFEVISLKDDSIIANIDKPNCIIVTDYLYKAKNQIQRERTKLINKYNKYLVDKNLTDGMISGFKKKRSYLINKLNEYYAIQYYYNRINLINNNFKITTSSMLIQDKMKYSIKYIPDINLNTYINNSITLRDKYISVSTINNHELMKDYIKQKIKFDKTENKKRELINTIILNKDIILHKFKFINNT